MNVLRLEIVAPVSRHQQVVNRIQQKIQSGELKAGEKLPTEETIAASLGVHWQTVHRAMRDLAREGWVERRPRHGTRVAPFVRNLALLLPVLGHTDGETEFYELQRRAFLQQFQEEHTQGRVLPVPLASGLVDDHAELRAMLASRRVSGVIFSALCPGPSLTGLMQQQGVPFVHIHAADGVPNSIWIDYSELYRLGVNYLVEQGCHQLGVIGGGGVVVREEIERHLGNAGLPPNQFTCVAVPEPTMDRGFRQGQEFLQAHPDLDGLFVADDVLARGVCMALLKLGRQVPEQLKTVCHFNKGAHFTYPFPVARVEVDALAVVEAAIARIEKLLAGAGTLPSRELVKPTLAEP